MNTVLISVLSYILIIITFRRSLVREHRTANIEFLLIIYLLTAGIMFDSSVNAGVVAVLFIINLFRVQKYESGLLVRIVLVSLYMTCNTIYIFSKTSYLENQNPYVGLIELIVYYLFFVVVKSNNYSKLDRDVILDAASLFSISVFLVAIVEIGSVGFGGLYRLYSVFKSPNQLGIYASIMLMVRLVFSYNTKLPRWLNNVIITINLIMLLLSQSRAAWIGMIVLMLFIIKDMNIKRQWKYVTIILGGGALLAILFGDQIFDVFQNRIISAISRTDASTSDRIRLAEAALKISKDHPFFGTGIRTFEQMAKSYGYVFNSANVHQPHNAYLELLQNLGIIGLIGFMSVIIHGYRMRTTRNRNLFYAFSLFFTIGMLSRIFNDFPTSIWFWAILGLA